MSAEDDETTAPEGDEASPEDGPQFEVADATLASTELPTVVLGTTAGDHLEQRERVLPGRAPPSVIFYPIYLLLVLSGGLAANVALDTDEWSFAVIVQAGVLMFAWNWLYVIAWTYRRTLLKYFSALCAMGLEILIGLLSLDRAAPQRVPGEGLQLVARGPLPSLEWAAWLLFACAALMLLHIVWVGRGWRTKAREGAQDDAPSPPPEGERASLEQDLL